MNGNLLADALFRPTCSSKMAMGFCEMELVKFVMHLAKLSFATKLWWQQIVPYFCGLL